MKKRSLILLLLFAMSFILINCGSESEPGGIYTCSSCVTKPDALAADDTKDTGVYKGAFGNSSLSGTVKVDIEDSSGTGSTVNLNYNTKAESVLTFQSKTGNTFYFSGNGSTFSIEIGSDGSVDPATQNLIINSENMTIAVIKETSEALIKVYEGTFTGTGDPGVWNMVVKGEEFGGIYSTSDGSDYGVIKGSISNDTVSGDFNDGDSNNTISGAVSGDTMSGDWNLNEYNGTWSGKRTL